MKTAKRKAQAPAAPGPAAGSLARYDRLAPARALAIPLGFALALAALSRLPMVVQDPRLTQAFLGAAGVLVAWHAVLRLRARARGRTFALEIVLRPQHYLQACAQGSVLLYWGYYWREVYHSAPLILAQLLFAYAFDMLLAWSRRKTYTLGFGPFPIIFSINLFLWFKADWFYLQFLMVAVGFFAKELIAWPKDGRRTHIFNPSSFPLSVFAVGLILTRTTHLTWGEEIATTQLYPPHMYLFIFLIGLPSQILFGVVSMTMSAVVTLYLFGFAYFAATGTYLFIDSYVPIAVFLGMHLLFTDPSTSPRTELGRIIFGVLYALSIAGLYTLLGRLGAPTFYDKLLPVPLLNLSIQLIDRLARSEPLRRLDPAAWLRGLAGRRRNFAYVAMWVLIFAGISAAHGLGDYHPGHAVPFWQKACAEGRRDACGTLALIERTYCERGSPWACNEIGALIKDRGVRDYRVPGSYFQRACTLGNAAACENARAEAAPSVARVRAPRHSTPGPEDFALLLRIGKGPLPDVSPKFLFEHACEKGWPSACGSFGLMHLQGKDVPRDPARAGSLLELGCSNGDAVSCSNLGFMFRQGDGVSVDRGRAHGYLQRACDLGMANACRWLTEEKNRS